MAGWTLVRVATPLALLAGAADAVYWIKGGLGQSCAEACQTGCLEDEKYYPKHKVDFESILEVVDGKCTNVSSGGMRYDPSVDGGLCAYQRAKRGACDVRPPPMTARLCPCKGSRMKGWVKLGFKAHCPHYSKKVKFDCAAGYANHQHWSEQKKIWCCCNTGKGCLEEGEVVRVATVEETGLAFENALAKEVGVAQGLINLVPPMGTGEGTSVQFGVTIETPVAAEIEGTTCETLEKAVYHVDWTNILLASAGWETKPMPYNITVSDFECHDRVCDAWHWGEDGKRRPISEARQKWCCGTRGCSSDTLWIFVLVVCLLNVVALACLAVCRYRHCGEQHVHKPGPQYEALDQCGGATHRMRDTSLPTA